MQSQRSPLGLDGGWPDAHAFMFLLQLADRHAQVWVREHGYTVVRQACGGRAQQAHRGAGRPYSAAQAAGMVETDRGRPGAWM